MVKNLNKIEHLTKIIFDANYFTFLDTRNGETRKGF